MIKANDFTFRGIGSLTLLKFDGILILHFKMCSVERKELTSFKRTCGFSTAKYSRRRALTIVEIGQGILLRRQF